MKGKSQKHYDKNPESKAKKAKYDKEFNKKPEQRAKRSELSVKRRRMIKDGEIKKNDDRDLSHTKNGLVLKHKSTNRGSKSDTNGDKRARGNGKKKNKY
jgi:hypothetical protein